MKFIVVSDKTIERSIAESQILDNMKSDKERIRFEEVALVIIM